APRPPHLGHVSRGQRHSFGAAAPSRAAAGRVGPVVGAAAARPSRSARPSPSVRPTRAVRPVRAAQAAAPRGAPARRPGGRGGRGRRGRRAPRERRGGRVRPRRRRGRARARGGGGGAGGGGSECDGGGGWTLHTSGTSPHAPLAGNPRRRRSPPLGVGGSRIATRGGLERWSVPIL